MNDLSPIVLVVDDEVQIRRFLRTGFELNGFVVHEAGTGAEAIRAATLRPIDLVIIEVSPVSYVAAAPGPTGEIAYRLWQLTRDAQRDNYRALGVPTVEWCEEQPLTQAIEELLAWPRGRRAG